MTIRAETSTFRGTIGLDFKRKHKRSDLAATTGHKEMPSRALKKPDAWGRDGPGGTWTWTMSWEVDRIPTKPQPELRLTTSASEKEKRLL